MACPIVVTGFTCICCRLLAVSGFDTHVVAEFFTPIRFEFFSYASSIIAAKNPGIRVEMLDKSKTRVVDKKKPQVCIDNKGVLLLLLLHSKSR